MSPLILVAMCLVCVNLGKTHQCMDENNEPVDWWVMSKMNQMSITSLSLARTGSLYAYITSATLANGWQLTVKGVDSSTSILANTLAPLYNPAAVLNSSTVLYNDSPPGRDSRGDRGHTKGVFMANGEEGFWLVHSIPSFPDITAGVYSYPDSGKRNGQSALCLSVNADQVEKIALQLQFNEIIPYYTYSKPALKLQYPTLTNRKSIRKPPYKNKATITTSGGVEFTSFAKTSKWGQDLYDWVGAQLGTALLVQTWRKGPTQLSNDCRGYHVFNIKSVVLKVGTLLFGTLGGEDHSKWAVSNTDAPHPGGNWVCIGDINRATTQFHRGGGTVCVKLPALWRAWAGMVNEVQECPHFVQTGVFRQKVI